VKRTILVCLMAGALLLGAAQTSRVWAQQQEAAGSGERETYTYTVKKGDTLWDISQELYRDPWVWPKVWQWNPQISNPHWIYPGTKLELYYTLPKPMAVMTVAKEAAPAPTATPSPPPTPAPPPAPPPQPPPPPPKLPAITFGDIDRVGFITPSQPTGSGAIVSEKRGDVLIAATDEVYVQIPPPALAVVGDRYFIFRTSDLIHHPVTGGKVGYLNTILGVLRIVEVDRDSARAKVERSFEDAGVGDKLMPYEKRSAEIILREGISPLEGNIVVSEGQLRLIGDRQIVFIDLGESEKVQVGNCFEVLRKPEGANLLSSDSGTMLSAEPIGELVVLKVEQDTAAALVTKCAGELSLGERVRLKMHN
jgi:hypothetical protein